MSRYLLDTNDISPLVTVNHSLRQKIRASLHNGNTFAITALSLNEFLYGIGTLPRSERNLQEWEQLKSDFFVYLIGAGDADKAAQLRLDLRKHGWQLDIVDSFIATNALRYDLVLLTADRDFSAIPALPIENWLG